MVTGKFGAERRQNMTIKLGYANAKVKYRFSMNYFIYGRD
jgi:translation initiation factor 2 gamma subunit (eIF-2gamma)